VETPASATTSIGSKRLDIDGILGAGTQMRSEWAFDTSQLRGLALLRPPPSYWFLWFGTVVNRLGGFVVPSTFCNRRARRLA
jgi:hypothetical protein